MYLRPRLPDARSIFGILAHDLGRRHFLDLLPCFRTESGPALPDLPTPDPGLRDKPSGPGDLGGAPRIGRRVTNRCRGSVPKLKLPDLWRRASFRFG
jgi:hypothetical protein